MTNNYDQELFDSAVQKIRKGTSYVELISELEYESRHPMDVRPIIVQATKYVEEVQKEALECAVEAFKQGRSYPFVCKALEECGFHNWDAGVVAERAKQRAEKELAGKSDGHESS